MLAVMSYVEIIPFALCVNESPFEYAWISIESSTHRYTSHAGVLLFFLHSCCNRGLVRSDDFATLIILNTLLFRPE